MLAKLVLTWKDCRSLAVILRSVDLRTWSSLERHRDFS